MSNFRLHNPSQYVFSLTDQAHFFCALGPYEARGNDGYFKWDASFLQKKTAFFQILRDFLQLVSNKEYYLY